MSKTEFLLSDINTIKGIGTKTAKLFKKKNINTVFDLLWRLPRDITDRSIISRVSELQIGKVQTVNVIVKKYLFPRLRNLPNRVICEDETGKLDCVFFNSYEGYIKKILPINTKVTISGKINYYKNKYQITNPTHVSTDINKVKKVHSNYSLTEGLTEKKYNSIIKYVLENLPELDEWLSNRILKKFDNLTWKDCILKLHSPKNFEKKGNFFNRLIFDEIFSTFLLNSKIRTSIKKIKKNNKIFDSNLVQKVISRLEFDLTADQIESINDINKDLNSNRKMFRLLQGDVGSGKTIVALISVLNVINSGYQVSLMAPTEILATQHFKLAKKVLPKNIKINLLTSKIENNDRKLILDDLKNNKTNLIIGTHSLFQEKIKFNKLGLVIIDEQHKFGVKQRKKLSDKGGKNCDILVMSATPIPRTMIMTVYGDMDTSLIKSKPKDRKDVFTYSKLDTKIDEIIMFVKKEIKKGNQIFWVCPLIKESKKIDQQSSIKRYQSLEKIFKDRIALLHGSLEKKEKDTTLYNFLNQKIDILVSTTIIEVGIDFPNASVIVIENANKFGLSQLHQLRGRVGRGDKQSYCILIFKSNLSENAKKRINILKNYNDGFKISEEDMKLRGYGDLLGFKQSGLQSFRLADPILNKDLFELAENEIKIIENKKVDFKKYNLLLKMYDRADILSESV